MIQHLECGLVEVKLAGDAEMTFKGYGAVFGNVDSYGDVIVPGAFKSTLAASEKSNNYPSMLLQHGGMFGDDMMPVGIWLKMTEDKTGLMVEGKLADTVRAREAYALMKMEPRPALSGLSIGYRAKKWSVGTKAGEPRRTLEEVDLVEVSLVTNPANPKARVTGVKSGATIRDAEAALRDVGFSQTEAKAILADGFKSLPQRDAGGLDDLADLLRRNIQTISR